MSFFRLCWSISIAYVFIDVESHSFWYLHQILLKLNIRSLQRSCQHKQILFQEYRLTDLERFVWLGMQTDKRIEQSVTRMMSVIDLARNIRERHNKPLKTPLK